MRWWFQRTKHPELHKRYDEQSEPKPKRAIFRARVDKYWYSKEQAICADNWIRRKKRNKHIIRDENWRVCNKCKQYKARDEYSYNKVWFHERNSACKECKNKAHREYRSNWWSKKDKEYRDKKRHLNIWEQVYFHWQIREVVEYKNKKWYKVKSIVDWTERRIDTWDNKLSPKTNCVRFTKLVENVKLVFEEEEKQEEKPKFEISLEPEEDYYY